MGEFGDVTEGEVFEDLRWYAVLASCPVVGEVANDVTYVVGVASEGGGFGVGRLLLYFPK